MKHVQLLKALADPTRLKILKLVLDAELCVCELQELLQISQPAVSQHLAKLKTAGLVQERKAGMWRYYRGDLARVTTGLQEVIDFLTADAPPPPEVQELLGRRSALSRGARCK